MAYPDNGDAPTTQADERAVGNEAGLARIIRERWDEGKNTLLQARKDYWMHLAFYLGEQWLWWDDTRQMVDQLDVAFSPLGPDRAHYTENLIRPNTNIVLGRMMKSGLAFEVPATDGADDAVRGARLAEKVLESYHRLQDWESVRHDELQAAWFGGTSFVCVEWDGTRGTELTYDPTLDKVIGTGDAYLRGLTIEECVLEPPARTHLEARWGIVGIAMHPEQARDQYRLGYTPEADAGMVRSPMHLHLLEASGKPSGRDQCLVLTLYERPHRGCRQGRYAIVIGDKVCHQGPWPFPFKRLNIQPFRQGRINGKWWGVTLMSDAIKIQFAYNCARSVLQEHLRIIGNARLMAPLAAFDEDQLTDEIGAVLWYAPDASGAKPEYLMPGNLPRWVSAEPENLKMALADVMHTHDTSRGEGFDRASGQALALLGEKDDTPLGMSAREQGAGWGAVASMVLELLEAKSSETRSATIPLTRKVTETVKWNGKMLRGQTTAMVPADAVMPHSQAARLAFWKDLWDRKIIVDPRQYARGVGLPPEDFEELLDPDAAKAHEENFRMILGYVELPEDFDDHAKHMSEHNRFRKTNSYKYGDPEGRAIVDDHIKFHEMKAHEELASQVMRAGANPALATMPQANEPVGAFRAPTGDEQQMAMMAAAAGGAGATGAMALPPGGTTPALESGTMQE